MTISITLDEVVYKRAKLALCGRIVPSKILILFIVSIRYPFFIQILL